MGARTMGPPAASPAWGIPGLGRLAGRRGAAAIAELLDALVDSELEMVRMMPVHLRGHSAEVLALLVTLASDHRLRARGWIGRRELRRRVVRTSREIDEVDNRATNADWGTR